MTIVRTSCVTMTVIAFCAQAALAEVKPFKGGVKIGVVAGATLTKSAARAYRDFRREKEYFGAFYSNPQCDGAFWVRDFNSLPEAKAAAKKGCEVCSEHKGQCDLYAVMVPIKVGVDAAEAAGLGKSASADFLGKYQRRQVDGRYGAFAISGATYGQSWDWVSEAEARATAIAYCESRVAKLMAGLNIEGRAWARKKGLTTCRVVDVIAP